MIDAEGDAEEMYIFNKRPGLDRAERRMVFEFNERCAEAAQIVRAILILIVEMRAAPSQRRPPGLALWLSEMALRLENVYASPPSRIRATAHAFRRRRRPRPSTHQSAFVALADVARRDAECDSKKLLAALESSGEPVSASEADIVLATIFWRAALACIVLINSGFSFERPATDNPHVTKERLLDQYGESRSALGPVIEISSGQNPVEFADVHMLSGPAAENLIQRVREIVHEMAEAGYSDARIRSTLTARSVPRWMMQSIVYPKPIPWHAVWIV